MSGRYPYRSGNSSSFADELPHHERIYVCTLEAADGILRRADNGFALDVERGVNQHAVTAHLLEGLQQSVKLRVFLPVDGLDAHTPVYVRNGGDHTLVFIFHAVDEQHIGITVVAIEVAS